MVKYKIKAQNSILYYKLTFYETNEYEKPF